MYRIRADIFKSGKNSSISFSEYSRNTFDKEIDAWNFVGRFKGIIENTYDMKGFVTCHVVTDENCKEIIMCKQK